MTKRGGALLLVIAAALFLLANRAAYKGYFQDDELNNISWTGHLPVSDYAKALVSPFFLANNFRPVGHFYYREMSLRYGLDFPKYLPFLHLVHILNIWLVWFLARRLGLPPLSASMGTIFFAFNMAVFDVYWKPMYVFDLLCATFTLACVLLYTRRRYILSFCAFWLAYKSKELAVMIPAVLACYEFWLAERKSWKPLIPFFLASLSFGLQGILLNPNTDNDYTFRFTFPALWTCLRYYSSRLFLIPYAGLTLLALPFFVRDRRLWFGFAVLCLFFVPLMFLPGRLFSAYCYVPLTGLVLMIATLSERRELAPVVALACIAWIPWNFSQLRKNRSETLALDAENRAYVTGLSDFVRASKEMPVFVYDGRPSAMHQWGIEGALAFLYGRMPRLYAVEDKEAAVALKQQDVALLKWNSRDRKLIVFPKKTEISYLDMNEQTPMWQFGSGWYSQEDGYRWIAPHASATLTQPPDAEKFELTANVSPDHVKQTGPIGIEVKLNGVEIGKGQFTTNGVQTLSWPAPQFEGNRVAVDIEVTPEYRPSNGDTRQLGIAVVAFGFRTDANARR